MGNRQDLTLRNTKMDEGRCKISGINLSTALDKDQTLDQTLKSPLVLAMVPLPLDLRVSIWTSGWIPVPWFLSMEPTHVSDTTSSGQRTLRFNDELLFSDPLAPERILGTDPKHAKRWTFCTRDLSLLSLGHWKNEFISPTKFSAFWTDPRGPALDRPLEKLSSNIFTPHMAPFSCFSTQFQSQFTGSPKKWPPNSTKPWICPFPPSSLPQMSFLGPVRLCFPLFARAHRARNRPFLAWPPSRHTIRPDSHCVRHTGCTGQRYSYRVRQSCFARGSNARRIWCDAGCLVPSLPSKSPTLFPTLWGTVLRYAHVAYSVNRDNDTPFLLENKEQERTKAPLPSDADSGCPGDSFCPLSLTTVSLVPVPIVAFLFRPVSQFPAEYLCFSLSSRGLGGVSVFGGLILFPVPQTYFRFSWSISGLADSLPVQLRLCPDFHAEAISLSVSVSVKTSCRQLPWQHFHVLTKCFLSLNRFILHPLVFHKSLSTLSENPNQNRWRDLECNDAMTRLRMCVAVGAAPTWPRFTVSGCLCHRERTPHTRTHFDLEC